MLREKKVLQPTELGFVVTRLMKDNFKGIVDVAFTAGMEEKLDKVEEGEVSWQQVVSDFYQPFEKDLEAAGANIDKVKLPDPVSDVPCDKCGAMMVIKTIQEIEAFCPLDGGCQALMERAFKQMDLSARAYQRLRKVARTIADLDGADQIREKHLAEAIRYRRLSILGENDL